MKILVVGQGGREHAIAWQIAKFDNINKVFVAPGNAGTALEPNIENIDIDPMAFNDLIDFAKGNAIDLTIIGPEAPLANGIVDIFLEHDLKCFGPKKACAVLESSKAFAKEFMCVQRIPTAKFQSFTDADKAKQYINEIGTPLVIKADGLAAGKGVIIAHDKANAVNAVEGMLGQKQFGKAGAKIIIEEFLEGVEASFICLIDGENILPLATSQDHKARDDGDKGPNTGGMGAYSPAPMLTPLLQTKTIKEVVEPVVKGMQQRGTPYVGFLYVGLMLTTDGQIKVLEFNCRLGDPETQPILMRLHNNLAELCLMALDKKLSQVKLNWDKRAALGVVLAAKGYPDKYHKGDEILGLETMTAGKVFHAGSKLIDHKVVTNGGRVLCVTALGETIAQAKINAYTLAEKISFNGMFYRHDIGAKALEPVSKII